MEAVDQDVLRKEVFSYLQIPRTGVLTTCWRFVFNRALHCLSVGCRRFPRALLKEAFVDQRFNGNRWVFFATSIRKLAVDTNKLLWKLGFVMHLHFRVGLCSAAVV